MLQNIYNEADTLVNNIIDQCWGFKGVTREFVSILLWINLVPLAGILVISYTFVVFIRGWFTRK